MEKKEKYQQPAESVQQLEELRPDELRTEELRPEEHLHRFCVVNGDVFLGLQSKMFSFSPIHKSHI
jgi:hypothetical protein